MNNGRMSGVLLWALGLVLVHFFLVFLPEQMTLSIWVTYGVSIVIFLAHLVLWLSVLRPDNKSDKIYYASVLLVSTVHMGMQLILCILALVFPTLSVKTSVMLNGGLMLVMCVFLALSIIGKNHIESVEQRQKDHHMKL